MMMAWGRIALAALRTRGVVDLVVGKVLLAMTAQR